MAGRWESVIIHVMRPIAILFLCILVLAAFIRVGATARADAPGVPACIFDKNLRIGMTDPAVRCLQAYLNSHGFRVSSLGPGSLGNETDYYGSRTAAAVAKWQEAMRVSPAQGFFGPLSRLAYQLKPVIGSAPVAKSAATTTTAIPPPASMPPQISAVTPDHITDGDTVVITGSGFAPGENFIKYSTDSPWFPGRSVSADTSGMAISAQIRTLFREKLQSQFAGFPPSVQRELQHEFARQLQPQFGAASDGNTAYMPLDIIVKNAHGASAPFKIFVNVIP